MWPELHYVTRRYVAVVLVFVSCVFERCDLLVVYLLVRPSFSAVVFIKPFNLLCPIAFDLNHISFDEELFV